MSRGWSGPINGLTLEVAHSGVLGKLVSTWPARASASRLGVWISLPKALMSEYPTSSARITSTFGRAPAAALSTLAGGALELPQALSPNAAAAIRPRWNRLFIGRSLQI